MNKPRWADGFIERQKELRAKKPPVWLTEGEAAEIAPWKQTTPYYLDELPNRQSLAEQYERYW